MNELFKLQISLIRVLGLVALAAVWLGGHAEADVRASVAMLDQRR